MAQDVTVSLLPTPPQSPNSEQSDPFVLIAGGSITGLSLAVMLEQAGVDFRVIEAGPVIAPQVGAGLAFFPGGARIIDQLGLFPELVRVSSVFDPMCDWRPDGKQNVCVQGVSSFFEQTLGYPVLFLDRQEAVRLFYDAIVQKEKVITGARIARVHETETSVTVHTNDGRSFTGGILVGCDGVKSAVRSEMWRISEAEQPGYLGKGGPSEVQCNWRTMFGISAIDHVPRSANLTMNQDFACALMSRGHYAYLVLHMTLPKTLVGNEIKPYDNEALEQVAKEHWNDPLQDGVTFGDVYSRLTRKILVPIQEYVLQKWYHGRIMLLGDAVHKTHPATGQGANLCLEDNAVFMNLLLRRLKELGCGPGSDMCKTPKLSRADCNALFAETERLRAKRSKAVSSESFFVISLYAWKNPLFRLISRYLVPLIMPDFILGVFMETTRPAPCLEQPDGSIIPGKERSDALVGFDDENPPPKASVANRVLQGLTCLALVHAIMQAAFFIPWIQTSSAADPTALGFMMIILAEGWRRCNIVSPIRFSWLWAILLDLYGIRIVGPLYLLADIAHGMFQGRMRYSQTGHPVFISAAKIMAPLLLTIGLVPALLTWLSVGSAGTISGMVLSPMRVLPATATAVLMSAYGYFSTDTDAPLGTRYRNYLRPGLASVAAVLGLMHVAARLGFADGLIARPLAIFYPPVLMWQLHVVAEVTLWCDVEFWSLSGILVLLGHGMVGPGASSVGLWLWRDVVMNKRPHGRRFAAAKA